MNRKQILREQILGREALIRQTKDEERIKKLECAIRTLKKKR